MSTGYIYIRTHSSYDEHNACKLGRAQNIPERDTQYATGEIERGRFELVLEVNNAVAVERALQIEFDKFNVRRDGGTEFYSKKIINFIEPCLEYLNIWYRRLSNDEIENLVRLAREKSRAIEQINYIPHQKIITARPDQVETINKVVEHFDNHDKAMLVLMCGVGKTLISLWAAQQMKIKKLLIGVPNKLLLSQWAIIIHELFGATWEQQLSVSGGTTDDDIIDFVTDTTNKKYIILTTYSSAHKVKSVIKSIDNYKFDMKILDEAHHLTGEALAEHDNSKRFIKILDIPAAKQLALTATLKNIDGPTIISNDSDKYFGNIVDRKCLLWAINENIVCDYVVQTMITNNDSLHDFGLYNDQDKRLLMSAFAALKSIALGHSNHVLIYANCRESLKYIIWAIETLISSNYFTIPDLYYSPYHSNMRSREQRKILDNFDRATFAIIACVYCLGEGYDNPNIDAVVFAENMTSNIRIVQAALRAGRKNKFVPNKIAKIILPVINRNDWLDDNNNLDLKKVREVVWQMGLEDELIMQKINVFHTRIEKHCAMQSNRATDIGEYDATLTQQLRLKTIKRETFILSYEKAIALLKLKNIKTKEQYYALCETESKLPKDPETIYKGQFINWLTYLNIDSAAKYYDIETCKDKVQEYLGAHDDIVKDALDLQNIARELSNLDSHFPPYDLWMEYYNVKSLSVIISLKLKRKKRLSDIIDVAK